MYHSRAFPWVSRMKYRLWKRQLFSFSSMSRKPHTRFNRSKYGMLKLTHITGTCRGVNRETSQMDKQRENVKGARGDTCRIDRGRPIWRISHHSFTVQVHTHTHTVARACTHAHTEEERNQLTLSSFSCDVIEAEQKTLKPEAEWGPPPQPKITDCTQDLHTRTFPLAREEGGGGEESGSAAEMCSLEWCHACESQQAAVWLIS